MPTAKTYKREDKAFVRRAIFSPDWTPDPMPSAAWRGIVGDQEALVPDPQPTASGDPTIYAAWDLKYTGFEGDYGGENAPVRYGRLRVTGILQRGALPGYLDSLFEAVVARVEAADPEGPLSFDCQTAEPVSLGAIGPWNLQLLEIPFCGG